MISGDFHQVVLLYNLVAIISNTNILNQNSNEDTNVSMNTFMTGIKQHTRARAHTHTHTHIYIYIYICVCVCVLE